jgi:hypothetical protein
VAGANRLTGGHGDAQNGQTYEQPSHESILANWPKRLRFADRYPARIVG